MGFVISLFLDLNHLLVLLIFILFLPFPHFLVQKLKGKLMDIPWEIISQRKITSFFNSQNQA